MATETIKKPDLGKGKGTGRRYPQAVRARAVQLMEQGKTPNDVAEELGVGVSNLHRWRAIAEGRPYPSEVMRSPAGRGPTIVKNGLTQPQPDSVPETGWKKRALDAERQVAVLTETIAILASKR